MKIIDPEKLYKWANTYFKKHSVEPNMRQATKRFKCRMDDIESAVSDYSGEHYLGIAVAIGGEGGYSEFEKRSDCLIEAY